VKFFTYKKPGFGRYKQIVIQYIKLMLPTPVTEWIQRKKEQPILDGFIQKIHQKRQRP